MNKKLFLEPVSSSNPQSPPSSSKTNSESAKPYNGGRTGTGLRVDRSGLITILPPAGLTVVARVKTSAAA